VTGRVLDTASRGAENGAGAATVRPGRRSRGLRLPWEEIVLVDRLAPFRARIVASVAAVAMLGALAATPQLLGSRLGPALDGLSQASPGWLWAAGAGFAASLAASALAWHVAARACGGRLGRTEACASYAAGSLVNSLAPAKLGDAVRLGLFARSLDSDLRVWRAGGIFAALAVARALAIGVLVLVGAALGAFPLWLPAALPAVACVLAVAAYLARNDREHRFARLFDALAHLERSPREAAMLLGWVAASTLARVAGAAAVAAAFGLPQPVTAALLVVPALDLAGLVPLTPGNIGVASGAVAVALEARGIRMTDALTAGIALHAVEMIVGLGLGSAGSLYLLRGRAPRLARPAALGAAAMLVVAFGGTVLVDLV
jgi:uncharacterized membrane protein YbhN (UPF0104 family)